MRQVTFNSEPAFLLDDLPDWSGGIQLDAEIPARVSQGITAREDRRPKGDTLRLSLKYSSVLQGIDAVIAFRNSLQALNVQPVLCPLWPYPIAAGDTPSVTTAYYALLGDGQEPEIQPASALPFSRPAYPLLVGRLTERPNPTALTDQVELVSVSFTENDESAISLAVFTAPAGLTTPAGSRPLFPFRPNWANAPKAGGSDITADRREIGQGRKTADAFYDQPARRLSSQAFTLQADEPWNLLRFFADMGSVQKTFWLGGNIVEGSLTLDVGATDSTLKVNGKILDENGRPVLDESGKFMIAD